MDIFSALSLLGGLALFLYGMDLMGKSLERQAGSRLQSILERLTARPAKGFLLGAAATAIIQSSSATTVMVVGFVNSGIMKLHQACGVIMGANVGTTATSWLLSLSGIEGDSLLVRLLKPSSFAPALALTGVILFMFVRNDRTKNTGSALLGFAILMTGMDAMSAAVRPLADEPAFTRLFTLFSNPLLGVLCGALLTAVIQSSSAAIGILQALSATGAVTFASAIPIIMGQNIGTCVTALISSIGANRSARRAAFIHLYFNVIGAALFLSLYLPVSALFPPPFAHGAINSAGIAAVHTCFNLLSTAALLPFSRRLEQLACLTVPDSSSPEPSSAPDERLLITPSIAVEQSRHAVTEMARTAQQALLEALKLTGNYDASAAASVLAMEDRLDRSEDRLGTYLVKLSAHGPSAADSREAAVLLHLIGDLERIGDHAVNLTETAQELHDKQLTLSADTQRELGVLCSALREIMHLSVQAFENSDPILARRVEPLEQVVDDLARELKKRRINRLQIGLFTIEMGFILADFTANCERAADHCSNIAATVIEAASGRFGLHSYTVQAETSDEYRHCYEQYRRRYSLDGI